MASESTRPAAIAVARGGVGFLLTLLALGFLGRVWWGFDLMANYRPQVGLVLIVVGVAVWTVDRDARLAALFGGAVGLAGLLSLFFGPHATPSPLARQIDVVSFNVGVSNPHRDEVASYLEQTDPDVVFLFESSFEWEEAVRRTDLPLTMVSVVPRDRLAGVTVLASPDLAPSVIDVGIRGEVAAVSLVVDGAPFEIIGAHPPSPTSSSRAARRDRILREVGDWVASREAPVVLVGDLNATPWSAAYRTLRWRGGLFDSMAGKGYQASWPVDWGPLTIPIDHVLHTRGVGTTARRLGPSFGSAHYPVLVTVGRSG